MKTLLCAIAALAAAPTALADEFCDDLKTVLAAGSERPAPYDSLVEPDKKLYDGKIASMAPAKLLGGLPEGAVCNRYTAGLTDGIVGGGTHNYIECQLGSGRDVAGQTGELAVNTLKATRSTLTGKITACLGASGWTGGNVVNVPSGRLSIERATFKPASGPADIVIETESRATRAGDKYATAYSMRMQIRTPTLFTPPPKPAG